MVVRVFKYQKQYHIKSYEVDCHSFLRIVSLMNFLQEAAVESAEALGFGFKKCRDKGVVWVGSNYLIKIARMPKINEHIVIETWPAEGKLWGAVRNFSVKDEKNNVIISAISQWVLIDFERRRPVMLNKYFPEYDFLNEKVMDDDFHKLPAVENPDSIKDILVRYDDIDINNHVNNAVYPLWASEGLAPDYRMKYIPSEIEICFKKEALLGERIEVCTKQNGNESFHTILDKNSGAELADIRFIWRKITSE
ncbi:MAG: hypothetical protein IJ532_03960 [Alphaproteobacteria bacterium]|nr:hypothetical protein [Alphaproteobacteria bacterium]